jgi:hypothetical protein
MPTVKDLGLVEEQQEEEAGMTHELKEFVSTGDDPP